MTDTVIVPDDKDWTWVVGRACPECGADVSSIPAESVAQEIRDNADAWEEILRHDPGELRRRPRPDRWSALEYAAHVRDVYVLYRERLRLMMECDDPLYPNWDQDAASKSYRAEDPGHVATGLSAAAEALAADFEGLSGDDWQRPGRRSDGACFTIEAFARYLLHDPVHHLWDVTAHRS